MSSWRTWLFPATPRQLPHGRAWNIGFRTAHLGVTGVLLGGHVFGIEAQRLLVWLAGTLFTGGALWAIEAFPHGHWFYQGRGLLVLTKLGLLCLVPFFWEYRVAILAVVLVLASVGSHMPRRFRYYSLLDGRVIEVDKRAPLGQGQQAPAKSP